MADTSNPLAAGVPALQPPSSTQAMISPDGKSVADIPVDRVHEAIAGGYRMGVDMVDPDGNKATIPVDRAHDAVTNGGYKPAGQSPAAGQGMKTSIAPSLIRGTTAALPAAGAITGGALASPGVVSTPVGVGLGAAAGKSAELGINHAIFGNEPNPTDPSNTSKEGLKDTAITGAVTGLTEGAFQALPGAASKTGEIADKIWNGKGVAQAPAEETLRSAAQASAEDAGVEATASKGGMRTVMDQPITAAAKTERATYQALNKAAETDMKSLFDYRSKLEDALEDPTNIGSHSQLAKELDITNQAIKVHSDQAVANGVSPETLKQAEAMTQQRYAMETAKKQIFNNESVVSGNQKYGHDEEINVESAIRNAENLDKPSKYAPEGSPTRLRQAFGDKGADELLQGLYDAKQAGVKAMNIQSWATRLGKATLLGRILSHAL